MLDSTFDLLVRFPKAVVTGSRSHEASLEARWSSIVKGLPAIEKYYADKFAEVPHRDHVAVVDPDSPYVLDGSTIWATGTWSLTVEPKGENPIPLNGYWSTIYVPEGNVWKEKMQTWNIAPATT